jgi:hypothetical protein
MILMILYSGSGAHATLRTKFFGEPERLRAIFAFCLLAAKGTECTLRNRAHIGAHRCQTEHRPSIAVSGPALALAMSRRHPWSMVFLALAFSESGKLRMPTRSTRKC